MLLAKYGTVLLNIPSRINIPQPLTVLNTSVHTFVNATQQFAFAYKTDSGGVAFLENWEDTAAWVNFEDKVYILLTLPPSLTSPMVWSYIAQEKLPPLDYQP